MYICLALAFACNYLGLFPTRMQFHPGALIAVLCYYYNYYQLSHADFGIPGGLDIAWSLMIEEHFYFVFPPIYKMFVRRGFSQRKQMWLLISICIVPLVWRFAVAAILHGTQASEWAYRSTDTRFDSILWGCILAIAGNPLYKGDVQYKFLDTHKRTLALLGLSLIVACLVYRSEYFRNTIRYTLIPISLYPVFFYCVRSSTSFVGRILETRVLRSIGQLSYAMYLIHFSFLLVLPRYFPNHLATVIIAFISTAFCALIMRYLVEDPLRKAFP